ncbi:hypothetical protein FIA58_007075 [Flavobacterium jejuense]|uniref:RES domain-containing protein n=1 Tax=Flavobacterium jejuense TaxID=1544455 RepID=A0ABX0IUF0_9FLAO|nr:hypothetical protein [Flavobacterium jejuense]NHN25434.1 hypothetical protein [Flavobacterium jejuense]
MIRNLEKELSSFDFKNSSIKDIEQLFSDEILGHSRPTVSISPEGLFRARIISEVSQEDLKTAKSIWYPDFKEIKQENHRLNRCSDKGQNFFYSSNSLEAVIKELDPKDNDKVMIGIFHKRFSELKITSQYAGIEVLKNNLMQNSMLRDYKYRSKNDELIEKYISSKFQQRVKDNDEEYVYKSSIAFSNILLKNEEINCIIYPSVASNLNLVNYGIKPEFVDDFLFCDKAFTYEIKRTDDQYKLLPLTYAFIPFDKIDKVSPKESFFNWQEISQLERKMIKMYSR